MMAENPMESSLITSILILPQPRSCSESICSPTKRALAQIRVFEAFGFKYYLIAPKESAGKHVQINGVLKFLNSIYHFHRALGTGCIITRARARSHAVTCTGTRALHSHTHCTNALVLSRPPCSEVLEAG
jgi:hypothetical protein